MKYTELSKQSKKAQREYHKKNRVMVEFNTGSREMQTDKKMSRAKQKRLDRKAIQCYN